MSGEARPIVWSAAGTDSGGGAGLAADQRAADAFGVHLCPVVCAVTAQNSRAVTRVEPLPVELIEAQFEALATDLPPRAIKTGLLGGAAQVRAVARWVDRLCRAAPVALVVDPVLASSTGAAFADAATVAAYRDELLPRATVVTPNLDEARVLLGSADARPTDVPELARALQALGADSVCITGGDSPDVDGRVLDWLAGPHADGWLASPRITAPHRHGTGCTFASSLASALAHGFVAADAAVLAKMATGCAIRHGYPAGAGAGPVHAQTGFAVDPSLLPLMSWGNTPVFAPVTQNPERQRRLGLYAVVDSAERLQQALAGGVRTLQLRIKAPASADAAWHAALRDAIARSVAACWAAGAELFINDHWQIAHELGAGAVHLGQEDLSSLGERGRAALRESGLAVGISSHSLWELCRAASLAPRYIACGPVWPTLTKAMPWLPQGPDNLAWWVRMVPSPVVAIGGILDAQRVGEAAASGADGVCVVRALGSDPALGAPPLLAAFAAGTRPALPMGVASLPHPTLAKAGDRPDETGR